MYLRPIKLSLQALWAAGAAGSLALAVAHPESPVPLFTLGNPWAVWAVGPMFAAFTARAAALPGPAGIPLVAFPSPPPHSAAAADGYCPRVLPPHIPAPPPQGLCFKEGACFGKPESFALFALVPLTLLGHLFGLPEGALFYPNSLQHTTTTKPSSSACQPDKKL